MRPSFSFGFVLAVTLLACSGFGFYGQAQTASPHCRADGSPRDESGRPHCCADGYSPNGEAQCWCEPRIVRGEYRNPKQEYEVSVPDGIAEILGCSGIGNGFRVSLAQPESGEGDWGMNSIAVFGNDTGSETLRRIIDDWHRRSKEDSEKTPDSDHQFNELEQTFLSSLPAFRFKSARTERMFGKIIVEKIVANNPNKPIVYSITMITRADQYEKNKKLFNQIVRGFHYTPVLQHNGGSVD